MDVFIWSFWAALVVVLVSIVVGWVPTLLQRTQGEPPLRRLMLMTTLSNEAMISLMPYRSTIISFAAGVITFTTWFIIGIITIWHVIRDDDEETIIFAFYFGIAFSFVLAAIVGTMAGIWVNSLQVPRK